MKALLLVPVASMLLLLNGCNPLPPKHGLEFVVAVVSTNGMAKPSAAELEQLAEILGKRIDRLSRRWSVQVLPDERLSVKFDPNAKEEIERARMLLQRQGVIEMRFIHDDSQNLANQGIAPPGYRLMSENRLSPSGIRINVPYVVSKVAVPGLTPARLSRAGIGRDLFNKPEIMFEFNPASAIAFHGATTTNVGRQLAIILDGELYSAPIIRSPIAGGKGSITGAFTEEEALELVTVLNHPLPRALQIIEEKRF